MRRFWIAAALLVATPVGCGKPTVPETPESAPQETASVNSTDESSTEESPTGESSPAEQNGSEAATATSTESQRTVTVGPIRLTAPETWKREQPRSDFVEAEFSLPKVEGDERDGRLTVSMAGGSVEANIDRWRGQFGGKPEQDHQKELEVDGTTITIVDLGGTYQDAPGPFAPGVERPGYRMLAAIIPGEDILYFVKAYGPQPTMAHHQESFEAFLKTLEK